MKIKKQLFIPLAIFTTVLVVTIMSITILLLVRKNNTTSKEINQPEIQEVKEAMDSTNSFRITEQLGYGQILGEYVAPDRYYTNQTGEVEASSIIIGEDVYTYDKDMKSWQKVDKENDPYPKLNLLESSLYPMYFVPNQIKKAGQEDNFWIYTHENKTEYFKIYTDKETLLVKKVYHKYKSIDKETTTLFLDYNDPSITIERPTTVE